MTDATVTNLHQSETSDPIGDVLRQCRDEALNRQVKWDNKAHEHRLRVLHEQECEREALAEMEKAHAEVLDLQDQINDHTKKRMAPGV